MSRPATPWQMGLHSFTGCLWLPNAAGDGSAGLGPPWTASGTITQPAPTNADAGASLRRTRFANVITTLNQELGIRQANAADFRFWKGNVQGLGGFYFSAIFTVEKWRDNTGRLFVGLASSAAGAVVGADAVVGDVVGLWHKGTHGVNELYFLLRDNATTTETLIVGTGGSPAPTLSAGVTYRWELWCESAAAHVCARLSSVDAAGTKLWRKHWFGEAQASPRNTILLAPAVTMSNGGAVPAADDFAISIANAYVHDAPSVL